LNLYLTNLKFRNSQEIIESKEKTIDSLRSKLDIYESSVNKIIHNNIFIE
jgi:predicted transcriptional regulator